MSPSELFDCGTNAGGTGRALCKVVTFHLKKEHGRAEDWSFINHFRRKKGKKIPLICSLPVILEEIVLQSTEVVFTTRGE